MGVAITSTLKRDIYVGQGHPIVQECHDEQRAIHDQFH